MPVKKKVAPKKKVTTKKKVATRKTATRKKVAVKKTVTRKAPNKKMVTKAPVTAKKKTTAIQKKMTKSQILLEISENTGLSKKDVTAVFDELENLVERHVKKRSCGEFILPGLLKIYNVKKPARKARKGINPFTGEEMMFAAKKASTSIKIKPLTKLKVMCN